jgi:glycosyltransferase involved in cell wall biosynthesis
MPPLISVIIPHYNDLENLRRCLDLLDAQSVPRERIEVLIVDNNSPVGLPAVEEATDGRAKVVVETRKGAGLARNAGAAAASADVLAFVDSDCRPAPDWIENGLKALETCDVVGGRVRVGRGAPGSLTPAEAFECVFAFDIESYVRKKGFVPSGNMFVRRETLEKVGGFRGGVSEDVEWGRRAGSMGMKLDYGHDVTVEHPARVTWAELTAKWRRMSLEAYLLMREQRMGRLKWLMRSWAVLLSPVVHIFKILSSPELEAPSDRAKAVAALFAIRAFRFAEAHRVAFCYRDPR